MTKPSYEEQKYSHPAMKALHGLTPGGSEFAGDPKYCADYIRKREHSQHQTIIAKFKENKELKDELARVRGLLQRQWISVEERLPEPNEEVLITSHGMIWMALYRKDGYDQHWEMEADGAKEVINRYTHWMPLPVPPTFPHSSSLVPQGAESADIGKLDTVEEKCAYCKHTHTFQFDDIVDDDCPVVGCPCMHFLGSAETGGEKAAPFKLEITKEEEGWYCWVTWPQGASFAIGEPFETRHGAEEHMGIIRKMLANFPRSSPNQTASSGVEGAHEGITADKKGDSGEPENAQKSDGELRRMAQNMVAYGRHLPNCRTQKPNSDQWCDCGFKDANRWALAESSLSADELSWTDAWIEKLRPRSENCTFCGKPLSDELHHASPELLACSSLTADDYHRFSGASSPELLPTQLETI